MSGLDGKGTSRPGPLLAFAGPSGVGKDSVMQALVAAHPGARLVRRVITRNGRSGGEDFIAADPPSFAQMAAAGDFALHWTAHGLSYGIPSSITADLAAGHAMLVNLSRSVLLDAQARFRTLTIIHLTAPHEVLAARLTGRGRESRTEIAARLARADYALPEGLRNVHCVSNAGAIEETVDRLQRLIQPDRAQRCTR
ncbi:MAG: phosphonate metabolism protein/1,5-bisphosphokinase (PRPP-forming) PhnN [Pseudomonadota bacterium]